MNAGEASELETLRHLLWLRHGCPTDALYGDDGELQCAKCGVDFKRMTAGQIDQVFVCQARAALIRHDRAAAAVASIQREAAADGRFKITDEEIQAEVDAARRERRVGQVGGARKSGVPAHLFACYASTTLNLDTMPASSGPPQVLPWCRAFSGAAAMDPELVVLTERDAAAMSHPVCPACLNHPLRPREGT